MNFAVTLTKTTRNTHYWSYLLPHLIMHKMEWPGIEPGILRGSTTELLALCVIVISVFITLPYSLTLHIPLSNNQYTTILKVENSPNLSSTHRWSLGGFSNLDVSRILLKSHANQDSQRENPARDAMCHIRPYYSGNAQNGLAGNRTRDPPDCRPVR